MDVQEGIVGTVVVKPKKVKGKSPGCDVCRTYKVGSWAMFGSGMMDCTSCFAKIFVKDCYVVKRVEGSEVKRE
jgi:hypothetical protein